jgi:hypothetical protein
MESCVIGYAHAKTAEPGEQAETTSVSGMGSVCSPLTCMTPEKFATAWGAGADSGGRAVLDAIVGLE